MRGPRWAAVAILLFFGASILFVHLAYEREPAAGAGPAALEATAVPSPPEAVPPARGSAAARPPRAIATSAPPVPTDVPLSDPPPLSGGRDRDVNACVERAVRAAAAGEPKPTAPGRWPAIKRAREELRLKRVAARATCERELAL